MTAVSPITCEVRRGKSLELAVIWFPWTRAGAAACSAFDKKKVYVVLNPFKSHQNEEFWLLNLKNNTPQPCSTQDTSWQTSLLPTLFLVETHWSYKPSGQHELMTVYL